MFEFWRGTDGDACVCLRAVRVGGALLATVDGTAAIGLSGAAVESSGATSLRLADVQLQSTGSLDSSFGADVYVGMQDTSARMFLQNFDGQHNSLH